MARWAGFFRSTGLGTARLSLGFRIVFSFCAFCPHCCSSIYSGALRVFAHESAARLVFEVETRIKILFCDFWRCAFLRGKRVHRRGAEALSPDFTFKQDGLERVVGIASSTSAPFAPLRYTFFFGWKVSGIGSERRGFGWILAGVLCRGAWPYYRWIGVEHFFGGEGLGGGDDRKRRAGEDLRGGERGFLYDQRS